MASINKVIIIGNLTKDVESRSFPDGSPVANISVACNEKYKDKQGEVKESVEYVNIVFFGKLAEIVGKYLSKGKQIYVEGKLKTEKYTDKNGIERWTTKVIASSMQMLGGKSSEAGAGGQPINQGTGSGIESMEDDQIPF
jgi:single-strand DNA-binding protein